ncbi:hypothetical protein CEXT_170181 [Caerostris extrusa]|uniref:Uncharacterized protein n=1 Tax=Caerostris extrusa TaxID=172846 RepID=A0AAV4M3L7_CAEEX|nr:hypothetical protein CEXT_170181 [Caerostris extrusa]
MAPSSPSSDTIFNPDELHKTLYILKEIVNMFTGASSISTIFQQLHLAKSSEDKLFVLCNGFVNNNLTNHHLNSPSPDSLSATGTHMV